MREKRKIGKKRGNRRLKEKMKEKRNVERIKEKLLNLKKIGKWLDKKMKRKIEVVREKKRDIEREKIEKKKREGREKRLIFNSEERSKKSIKMKLRWNGIEIEEEIGWIKIKRKIMKIEGREDLKDMERKNKKKEVESGKRIIRIMSKDDGGS